MSVLLIDVYADIVCPWCFIGFRRLNAAVQSTGRAGDVAIRHRPFMIHPDAPPEGIDLWTMLERKYGTDPKRLFERVEAAALETGIPLDLSKQRRTYSTISAHTLLRHAGERGTQHALTDSLFTAYFLHAKNIGEPEVLATIAARHGFTAEEVIRLVHDPNESVLTRQEVKDAVRRGIRSVPVFLLDNRHVLAGAQPETVFRDAIVHAINDRIHVDRDRHDHTPEEEREIRNGALDDTIAATFPASDPLSSIPDPDDHDSGRE